MFLSVQIGKLRPNLDQLPTLLDLYQRGEPRFPDEALAWLSDVEKTMASVRVRNVSEFPVLRSRILKAADALHNREEKPSRSLVRSARNVAAAEALERAEEIIRGVITTNEERLQKFEDKLCEGITALALLTPLPPRIGTTTHWLSQIWRLLRSQDSTRPLATYLGTALSTIDRQFILEAVLSRLLSSQNEDVN